LTKIIKDTETAAEQILAGNVVAFPTETVYGLGANALNANAVLKVYEVKERPKFNPLIVHVSSVEDVEKYVEDIPEEIYKLMDKFSPGPITYILPRKDLIPDIVCAGLDTMAIRIPSHDLFNKVLKLTDLPISAPSANRFGRVSPTSAEDVLKELDGRIEYILDGGKCEIGIESTVVAYINDVLEILRPGFISKEDIEKVVGKVEETETEEKIIAPGMIKHHYSPKTPLYITGAENLPKYESEKEVGILDVNKYGDVKELAVNLFSDIRALDEKGYDYIITSKVKNEGIGRAVNDRLFRAARGFLLNVSGKMKFIEK
jgi:L-threonylcarbamoyladenylate synthase